MLKSTNLFFLFIDCWNNIGRYMPVRSYFNTHWHVMFQSLYIKCLDTLTKKTKWFMVKSTILSLYPFPSSCCSGGVFVCFLLVFFSLLKRWVLAFSFSLPLKWDYYAKYLGNFCESKAFSCLSIWLWGCQGHQEGKKLQIIIRWCNFHNLSE